MAKRGPKPQTALKLRRPAARPVGSVTLPEPPDYLRDDERAEFVRLTRRVASLGILERVDVHIFESAAILYRIIRECQKSFDLDGLMFQAPNGCTMANPLLTHHSQAQKQYLRCLADMGLTPASAKALGLGLVTDNGSSKWGDLLRINDGA